MPRGPIKIPPNPAMPRRSDRHSLDTHWLVLPRPASNIKIAALGREHGTLKELLSIPSRSRIYKDSAQISKCIDAADMLISEIEIDNCTNRLLVSPFIAGCSKARERCLIFLCRWTNHYGLQV